jgi:hypothetical protein
LEEYCELLEKIFDRVTARKIVRANGTFDTAIPQIRVTIDQEKQVQDEDSQDEGEWEVCDDNEAESDEFEYKQEEENGEMRTFRRPKSLEMNSGKKEIFLSSREPFYYKEVVVYHQPDANFKVDIEQPSDEDFVSPVLADHCDIFPLGYPTEQYLFWLKNDVHKAHLHIKAEKKAAIAAMQRDLFAGTQGAD